MRSVWRLAFVTVLCFLLFSSLEAKETATTEDDLVEAFQHGYDKGMASHQCGSRELGESGVANKRRKDAPTVQGPLLIGDGKAFRAEQSECT